MVNTPTQPLPIGGSPVPTYGSGGAFVSEPQRMSRKQKLQDMFM